MEKIAITGFGVIRADSRQIDPAINQFVCKSDFNKRYSYRIQEEVTKLLKNRKASKLVTRVAHLAEIACGRALEKASLSTETISANPFRFGIFMGVGPIPGEIEQGMPIVTNSLNDESKLFDLKKFCTTGIKFANPLMVLHYLSGLVLSHCALTFNIKGSNLVLNSFAAGTVLALEMAMLELQEGNIDYALVGGADHLVDYFGLATYANWRWFDNKDFIPGEAAAFIILEREQHALTRTQNIIATVERIRTKSAGGGNSGGNSGGNNSGNSKKYFRYVENSNFGAATPLLDIVQILALAKNGSNDFDLKIYSPNNMSSEVKIRKIWQQNE